MVRTHFQELSYYSALAGTVMLAGSIEGGTAPAALHSLYSKRRHGLNKAAAHLLDIKSAGRKRRLITAHARSGHFAVFCPINYFLCVSGLAISRAC
jgi:hypothetical protein